VLQRDEISVWSIGGMIVTRNTRINLKINLSLCHFVHKKFHTDRLGIESSELTGDIIKMDLKLKM
jgi:hypothetical protein